MSVLDQIKALDQQKAGLLKRAEAEGVAKAQAAVDELNALGFKYRLVSEGTTISSGGTRRTGIRQEVEATVKKAGKANRAQILNAMGVKGDKSGEQSVSNALAALKKSGAIKQDAEGNYTP